MSRNDVVWRFDNHIGVDEPCRYPHKYNHPYCETRAISENLALKFSHERRLKMLILNPSRVLGSRDKLILPRIIRLASRRDPFMIGDEHYLISLCYMECLSDAIILTIEANDSRRESFFINEDIKIAFSEFISGFFSCLGIKWSPARSLPDFFAYGLAPVMEAQTMLLESRNLPALTSYAVAPMGRRLNYSVETAISEINLWPNVCAEDEPYN